MKNNQFRAYIDKYLKKKYKNITVLTIDKDSNTRIAYMYSQLTGECIGTIILYFKNEFINITYSKTNKTVCKITNRQECREFDYVDLKQVIFFIDKAVTYFLKGV